MPSRSSGSCFYIPAFFINVLPALLSGNETVAEEIDVRKVSRTDVYVGVRRFCVGLAKKAILANSCASAADTLLPSGVEALVCPGLHWVCGWGCCFYMLQIYLDFSAYSDMAIGMGRMVGFHYLGKFQTILTWPDRSRISGEGGKSLLVHFSGTMFISLWRKPLR